MGTARNARRVAANDTKKDEKAPEQQISSAFSVKFEPTEGQALIDLLDVAVKSLGLQGAGAALHIASKIKQAHDAVAKKG